MQHLRRPLVTFLLLYLAPLSAFSFLAGSGTGSGSGPRVPRGVASTIITGASATDLRLSLPSTSSGTISCGRGRRVSPNGAWAWKLRSSSDDSDDSVGEGEQPQSWNWSAPSSWEQEEDRETDNPWDDSSQTKWDRLYAEGEKEKRSSTYNRAMADWDKGGVLGATDVDVDYSMPVEVVSFDLDDTLWSTMAVINQANAVLREHMSREHPALAEKFEIADLMKEVWKEKLQQNPELDPAPVNLTELRKAGLTRACELTGTEPSTVVESCFEVWRRARHHVEPHLFPGVLETLKALRERGVRLVAITNGNAQTDDIPCLKDLFEFCVLAEQVGERKPDPGPFKEAVKRAGYPSDNAVGGEWVHVGDDWASDCVGGKKMRMRTVLVRVPGKPAVGSIPNEDKNRDDEEEVQDDSVNNKKSLDGGPGLDDDDVDDDDDDDDAFPTLEDESLPADESPEGKAQRLRQQQAKARRKAEKLGILIDSYGDFEVDAGTAVANVVEQGQRETPVGDKTSTGAAAAAAGEERRREEEEAAKVKAREKRLEEEEAMAREELKNKEAFGREMTATAMGHPGAAQGPGKVTSMGTSSYLVDTLMKDFMDASLDKITELVGLVDEWSNDASTSCDGGNEDENAAAAMEAVVAGRGRSSDGSRGGASKRTGEKFCIECGVKIPAAAKFCPECGAKQETLAR